MSIELDSNELGLIEKAFELLNDHLLAEHHHYSKAFDADDLTDDLLVEINEQEASELDAVTNLRDKLIAANTKAVDRSMSEE